MFDKTILKEIYSISPYKREYKNKTKFREDQGNPVYGEITENGTNSMVNHFKKYFNKDTVFYDLGSGLGKMVLHIGLQYNIKKSVGIELSKERHKAALTLKEKYAPTNDKINFICKSFFDHDWSDATVIYIDNTMFDNKINERIFNNIPPGCLVLCKKMLNKGGMTVQGHEEIRGIGKTDYGRNTTVWFIKE